MPIYEYACDRCCVIFSFFSQRIKPVRLPKCPKCGNRKMERQMSSFALTKGGKESDSADATGSMGGADDGMPDMDDPRMARAMNEMEREMSSLDENNPKHLARMMRKMKDLMPSGTTPKELEQAIKRLEAGEDPEKIEADMGDVLGDSMDDAAPKATKSVAKKSSKKKQAQPRRYTRDKGLYDY